MKYSLLTFAILLFLQNFGFAAQYDSIADSYQKSKKLDVRWAIDDFSIFFYLEGIKGHSILDLASGEGHYSRKFAAAGASRIVAMDISPEMIALANKQEKENPKGITYVVGDASKSFEGLGQFDFVTGIFLLHYASNENQLCAFVQQIFNHLKVGGQFIGLNAGFNPSNTDPNYYRKYGFSSVYTHPTIDGSKINVQLFNNDGSVAAFHGYSYSSKVYEKCFKAAGFGKVEALPLLIDPKAVVTFGWEFWLDFIKKPSGTIVRAMK